MKILAFTDVHVNQPAYEKIKAKALKEKPDLMICCGDISIFGSYLDKTTKFLNNIGIPTLVIPGNHESPNELKNLCSKNKNLIYLHKGTYEIGDFLFFGWGTGGFSFIEEEFEILSEKFKKTFDKNKKLIFVTHAPIYKTNLDLIAMGHRGCKSTRKFIEEVHPVLTLCGHFHETFHKQDKIKNTLIINPGNDGTIIEIE